MFRRKQVMVQFSIIAKLKGIVLFLIRCCCERGNMSNFKVVIEDYTPTLEETDVTDLVNFIVELFCTEKTNEVQND